MTNQVLYSVQHYLYLYMYSIILTIIIDNIDTSFEIFDFYITSRLHQKQVKVHYCNYVKDQHGLFYLLQDIVSIEKAHSPVMHLYKN